MQDRSIAAMVSHSLFQFPFVVLGSTVRGRERSNCLMRRQGHRRFDPIRFSPPIPQHSTALNSEAQQAGRKGGRSVILTESVPGRIIDSPYIQYYIHHAGS